MVIDGGGGVKKCILGVGGFGSVVWWVMGVIHSVVVGGV